MLGVGFAGSCASPLTGWWRSISAPCLGVPRLISVAISSSPADEIPAPATWPPAPEAA